MDEVNTGILRAAWLATVRQWAYRLADSGSYIDWQSFDGLLCGRYGLVETRRLLSDQSFRSELNRRCALATKKISTMESPGESPPSQTLEEPGMDTPTKERVESKDKWGELCKRMEWRCSTCHRQPSYEGKDAFIVTGKCGGCFAQWYLDNSE